MMIIAAVDVYTVMGLLHIVNMYNTSYIMRPDVLSMRIDKSIPAGKRPHFPSFPGNRGVDNGQIASNLLLRRARSVGIAVEATAADALGGPLNKVWSGNPARARPKSRNALSAALSLLERIYVRLPSVAAANYAPGPRLTLSRGREVFAFSRGRAAHAPRL
jgi:hypothetical protein